MALAEWIHNVGEYYAAHYLDKGFDKDIADLAKAWRERGAESPGRRLASLADRYFAAKTQALDIGDPRERARPAYPDTAGWHGALLQALGYALERGVWELDGGRSRVPILLRIGRLGKPWLAVLEAPFCLPETSLREEHPPEEPLEMAVAFPEESASDHAFQGTWSQALGRLFGQEDAPRWAILLAGSQVFLLDRHTWAQARYLRFDWDEAFGRREAASFTAAAGLLSRETLCPGEEQEESLHEKLESQSHGFTHAVSENLQEAVRECIEWLADEWVESRRKLGYSFTSLRAEEPAFADGTREITAGHLQREALTFVYRILFCLYAEARGGELGLLPIQDETFRLGYSLEALRDLAEAGDLGESDEEGYYYHHHLRRLFDLIHQGFHPEASVVAGSGKSGGFRAPEAVQTNLLGGPVAHQMRLDMGGRKRITSEAMAFTMAPLTATLFSPETTPLLSRSKLRNGCLHKVIRRLSLGADKGGKTIGRINYAELGLNQIGAVYEGLLSYQGVFAKEDMIRVFPAPKKTRAVAADPEEDGEEAKDEAPAESEGEGGEAEEGQATWFVPVTREREFRRDEIEMDPHSGRSRVYKRGSFLLFMTGLDRVTSASYYTPKVLTEALVHEALEARLQNLEGGADTILGLTLCEMAMGSAAFLNEAIEQLAHRYLDAKQKEIGRTIEPLRYADELGRVKHYIATRNVYGVDLNAMAVELGALSLWLGSLHRLWVRTDGEGGGQVEEYQRGSTPWFGLRLRQGNSLIGARRAVWSRTQLKAGRHLGKKAEAPRQLKPGEMRGPQEVYHFLVWDEGMVPAAGDKRMRGYWPEECARISLWKKHHLREEWDEEDFQTALRICEAVDRHWEAYARERSQALEKTACTATVWPEPSNSDKSLAKGPTLAEQEGVKSRLEAQSGSFQRMKLLMDAWCAFYFWPLAQADALPTRKAWLAAAELLMGEGSGDESSRAALGLRLGFNVEALFAETRGHLPDSSRLAALVPWFDIARQVEARMRFHHWELVFTEVLGPVWDGVKATPKGFDLIVGNPPWIKVSWNDAPLLSDFDPLLGVRRAKSAAYNAARDGMLKEPGRREEYRREFQFGEGTISFLNDITLYPNLKGVQTNLYKNFIERSWSILGLKGVGGILHPEGLFDDPKGGSFRAEYYLRLVAHFQFKNQLMLFSDIGDRNAYSINVFRGRISNPNIRCIFNLFHPITISRSKLHSTESDPVPAIKNDNQNWDLRGHTQRIIKVDQLALELFAKLFENPGTNPIHARLPQVHSQQLLQVLKKFAALGRRLSDLSQEYLATEMFHESNSQREGIITREENPSYQPKSPEDWVVSGPHYYVGNPLNRSPRTACVHKNAYDDIDLTVIPDDYLPRAVYRPGDKEGNLDKFHAAIPEWPKPAEAGQPGFFHVPESDRPYIEKILGEPLKLYGVDPSLPGCRTARKFAYFSEWKGPVLEAVTWLRSTIGSSSKGSFADRFSDAKLKQDSTGLDLNRVPKPITSLFRYINRKRAQPANERTLIPSLVPPGATHIINGYSISFSETSYALLLAGTNSSIVFDWFIKTQGIEDIIGGTLRYLPIIGKFHPQISFRGLRLFGLTTHFSGLWSDPKFSTGITDETFTAQDPRLTWEHELPWDRLPTDRWERGVALRSDFARRQALLEIDVLVALALDLTLEELLTIYRVQFPVMRAYELADEYDAKGRRLPNTKRKDAGAKELRAAREAHNGRDPLTVSWRVDNGLKTVTKTYHPPFTRVDREEDYRVAWEEFLRRGLGSA